jgi:hypothetical protein
MRNPWGTKDEAVGPSVEDLKRVDEVDSEILRRFGEAAGKITDCGKHQELRIHRVLVRR